MHIFGWSRATLCRGRPRYQPTALQSLEARSRRGIGAVSRRPSREGVRRVHHLREQYPRWWRKTLRVLLGREGIRLSATPIDRLLACLRTQGQLIAPPRQARWARRRRVVRPSAIRKPRTYAVTQPGDLVQADTLDVRPLPGLVPKPFTARDVAAQRV